MWKLNPFERLHALGILLAHVRDPATLRKMWAARGERFPLFGGEAHCSFASVKGLMEKEPEKLPGIYAPMEDAETFFSQGYLPFLQKNPNHAARRARVIERVEVARTKLARLEALLDTEKDPEHAISRFLLEALAGIEPTADDVDDLVFFRKKGPVLAFFPKWTRATVFRADYQRAVVVRERLLERFAATGLPFGDSFFEAIWFNAGTLGFYPYKALDAVKKDPALLAAVREELDRAPSERPRTRALIMEMLRIHSRIASVNYLDEGRAKIALIATAVMDPAKFPDPERIDLTRDHSDSVSFAIPSPNRSCPGKDLAPEVMACVVAHLVRRELGPGASTARSD